MNTELAWFKSSYSGGDGEACVEVASTPSAIHVRDSKELASGGAAPSVAFGTAPWMIFVGHVAAGGTGA
ncbi:DUF397 domain-containing protein [Streptomyces sp. NPDC046821]|uniref:DUF397 domain-containing protein n=1 Tax=Streptomyces sp. NPDC046821 TaxID=3154702 RepID=UPI0033E2476E